MPPPVIRTAIRPPPPPLLPPCVLRAPTPEIEAAVGGRAALVRAVGNAAMTGFQLPKLLWLRQHESHHFAKTAAVLLPKDYVRFRMSGDLITDSLAA